MLGVRTCAVLSILSSAAAAGAQALRVTPLAGDPVTVRDWSLADGRLRGRQGPAGARWTLSLRRIWLLAPEGTPAPAGAADGPFLKIRGGPRIPGRLTGGNGRGVLVFDVEGGAASIARAYVQGLRVAAAAKKPPADAGFLASLADPPADDDHVYVLDAKGRVKRLSGSVEAVTGKELRAKVHDTELALPLGRVYGVVFAVTSGLAAQPGDRRGLADLRLASGEVLRGVIESGASGAPLVVRLVEGMVLRVPLARVREVELRTDKLVYLSSLAARETVTPALGRRWPVVRDHGLGGGPLGLGGHRYRRGFLLVPAVRLDFDLPRAFDRLVGEVGIPRARHGSARLRILAGGKQVGPALDLVADGRAHLLSRELGGARRLTIEVTATGDLDAGAQVILGDLRAVTDAK